VTFTWRPVYGLPAAATVALLLMFAPARLSKTGPSLEPGKAAQVLVQFRLEASGARHVSLAGTFTNWKPVYELHETAPGLWAITLPLPAGVHDYSFVVDGMRWIPDPYAPQIQDGFGGTSSRLALMTPAMRES
jgi:1,4-alpha-glucan branching enzyme